MKHSKKYFIAASIVVVLFFINAFTPVDVLGCFTRGLVAFIIAVVSGITAIVTAIISIRKRLVNDPSGTLWILLTLVLAVPLIALMYLA